MHQIESELDPCQCGKTAIVVPAGFLRDGHFIGMCPTCQHSTATLPLSEIKESWSAVVKKYTKKK